MMRLENDTKNVDSLESHDDKIIIFMNEIIEEVKLKVSSLPKPLPLNDLRISAHLKE